MSDDERTWELLGLLFQAHPWHGVAIGPEAPARVSAYIEIVPTDTVKYEIDKPSGHLKVDRPQQFSNVCPTLYGLIPQTYCGARVAAFGNAPATPRRSRGTATRSTSASCRRNSSRTAAYSSRRCRSAACG